MTVRRARSKRKAKTYELTKADLLMILDVLRANQSMELTVHAIKHIESQLKYPLRNLDDLMRMFSSRKRIRLASRTVEAEQVKSFLPEQCFPIANREELISKLIMAFERERMNQILAIDCGTDT